MTEEKSYKSIYIRVDMNAEIATGHVMRCLSIADAATEKGIKTIFISADENPVELVNERGYECIVLDSDWKNMEGELKPLGNILSEIDRQEGCMPQLLVDSYQVTEMYLKKLRDYAKVTYLDDLNRFKYPVDRLIVYAPYYRKWDLEAPELLLGPAYTPLRAEFRDLPSKKISENINNILVLTGGSDNLHIMKHLLESVTGYLCERHERNKSSFSSDAEDRLTRVTAICGRYNPDYEELFEKYSRDASMVAYGAAGSRLESGELEDFADLYEVEVLKAVPNLIDYIRRADVVITAGGTTLYEICACGTPAITYSFADNQLDNVLCMAEDGLMEYAGDVRSTTDDVCGTAPYSEAMNGDGVQKTAYIQVKALLSLYESPHFRQAKSTAMKQLVDGHGAERIVESIVK